MSQVAIAAFAYSAASILAVIALSSAQALASHLWCAAQPLRDTSVKSVIAATSRCLRTNISQSSCFRHLMLRASARAPSGLPDEDVRVQIIVAVSYTHLTLP